MESDHRWRGLRSLFWLGGEKGIQLAFATVSVGLIARTLGAEEYGEFQYLLSVLFVFAAFGLVAGSEVAAPHLTVCEAPGLRRRLLGSLFALRLLACLLAFTLLMTWALLAEPASRRPLLLILGLSLLVIEPFNVLRLLRETAQQTRIITVTRLSVSGVKLVVVAGLYVARAPLWTFVLVYSADYFLTAAIYGWAIRDDGRPWQWRAQWPCMLWLLRKGLVVWLGLQALVLIQRMDRLVLYQRLPAHVYGWYTAATSLLDSAWLFGPVAVAALAPSLVYRAAQVRTGLPWRFSLVLTALGVSAMLAIDVLAPWVVPLIFGAAFEAAVPMLRAVVYPLVPAFAALSLDAILIQRGWHGMVPLKWGLGLAAGAALMLPDLGIGWVQGPLATGAAYVTSLCVGLAGLWWLEKKRTGVSRQPI